NGFLHLARDTLDLVEEEAMKHDATEVTSSEAVYRRLDRVLVRMSFHQLALLAVSKADCSEFGEIMVTSLEKLTDDLEGRPSQTNLLAALSFLQLGCLAIPMSTLMAADPSDCLSRRRPRLEDGHRCATRKMWLSTGDVAAGTASCFVGIRHASCQQCMTPPATVADCSRALLLQSPNTEPEHQA
ncbi:unnamed protein product, partial [Symbiodinium microadriaticum]